MDFALLSAALLLTLLIAALGIYVIEWRMYCAARDERDLLRQDLVAMTADRDGWRSVGERAVLLAHLGTRVTARATRLVTAESEAQEP